MPALGSKHDGVVEEQAIDVGDHAEFTFAGKTWTNQGPCLKVLTASDASYCSYLTTWLQQSGCHRHTQETKLVPQT
jgi:hypothetical protein